MNILEINSLEELNENELIQTEGGVLPASLVYFGYGAAAGLVAGVAIGVAKWLD
jgi:lactobin A/cerein 7B family class IIb bacteriocin